MQLISFQFFFFFLLRRANDALNKQVGIVTKLSQEY